MFETNSSSCHCLILSKTAKAELPNTAAKIRAEFEKKFPD